MIFGLVFLWGLAAILTFLVWRRPDLALSQAASVAWKQAKPMMVRLPVALVAASLIAVLIPPDLIGAAIGGSSGFIGILVASALGGLIPGGPMVSFPLAIVIAENGAGAPQMVALITAWSVLALNRVIVFELPLMGYRFCLLRLGASVLLPPIAGLLALAVAP